ncbi:MAG: MMPL family transporter, partial [Enterobacteriaceae bacterium]
TRPMPVTPEQWLSSPVSEGWRLMWITLAGGESGVFIPVEGVKVDAGMDQLAQSQTGVVWVDRKASFDRLFALYRLLFSGLLASALVVVAISMVVRMGWRRGVICLIPSLLSLGCGLATLSLLGYPVNLFALLALALVLGIGINYTLFFSNPRGTPLTSLLAIILAMMTTLMTMGMLVFSSTQAISSFGIVLCSGIFSAFLLSMLTIPDKKKRKK